MSAEDPTPVSVEPEGSKSAVGLKSSLRGITLGLLFGILTGVLFGEYCRVLDGIGQAYVGLLQMTVLPYLTISLIAKLGRLDMRRAQKLGLVFLAILLTFWLVGVLLVVAVSTILPPVQGASFFSFPQELPGLGEQSILSRFIPTNIFRSLADQMIPAVVLFCLFFGAALIAVPGKEPLLDFLDLCSAGIGRMNLFLVRLAPLGLFALSAAAAGTMRLEELSRLQAYLIMFTLACCVAALGILPLLVSSLTPIRYRDLLHAAGEPVLTAIATGKLFVVLPQIVEKCEQLLSEVEGSPSRVGQSTANVVIPIAYSFPHLGKILTFVFISFAAWYVGRGLTPVETTAMAATGTVTSFASPLVTMPFLLDQYHLPQDLMPLFILPGFITMRLADVVGVFHLMALTLIVSQALQGQLRPRWGRLLVAVLGVLVCLGLASVASRWYLAMTSVQNDLDRRLLSLELPEPYDAVIVYQSRADAPTRSSVEGSTLERVKSQRLIRVGYRIDDVPYSYFNQNGNLVGLDVELMHRLATRLQVRLEFVPWTYETVIEQLESGEIDLAVGGLIVNPERLMRAGFTQSYETATLAVVVPDHRRHDFTAWGEGKVPAGVRLAVVSQDLAVVARLQLPDTEIVVVDSIRSFFESPGKADGLIIAAEEGAAWNVLYPENTVVIPRPVIKRPVGMAVRSSDAEWLRFLDGYLSFERLEGSLDRLRTFWIEGGGTQEQPPRWCVLRDVLHWLP